MTNTRALCLLLITRPRSSLATYFLFLLTMNPYISIKWFTFINHITHQVHHFTSICLPPLKPSFTSQKKSKILNQLLFTSRQDTRLSISVLDSFFFFFYPPPVWFRPRSWIQTHHKWKILKTDLGFGNKTLSLSFYQWDQSHYEWMSGKALEEKVCLKIWDTSIHFTSRGSWNDY